MTAAHPGRGTAAFGPLATTEAAGQICLSPSQRRRARRERRSLLDEGGAIAENRRDEIAERSAEIRNRRGLSGAEARERDDARDDRLRRVPASVATIELGTR